MLQGPVIFLLKQAAHVAQAALHFTETRSLGGTCGSWIWLNWLANTLQGSFCLLPHCEEHVLPRLAFYVGPGDLTQILMLKDHFTD